MGILGILRGCVLAGILLARLRRYEPVECFVRTDALAYLRIISPFATGTEYTEVIRFASFELSTADYIHRGSHFPPAGYSRRHWGWMGTPASRRIMTRVRSPGA